MNVGAEIRGDMRSDQRPQLRPDSGRLAADQPTSVGLGQLAAHAAVVALLSISGRSVQLLRKTRQDKAKWSRACYRLFTTGR